MNNQYRDGRSVLHDLAILYLAIAHGADDYLSDTELSAVVHQLEEQFAGQEDRDHLREVVMESLSVYLDADEPLVLVTEAMHAIRDELSQEHRAAFLRDLSTVARADGVVLRDERGVLASLAECWEVELEDASVEQPLDSAEATDAADGVFYDLAYLYLVLGHGTDAVLSESETRMMVRRLQEWQPKLDKVQIRGILKEAMNRYAEGPSEEVLSAAIRSVRDQLSRERRMAALEDLIKIANADGVFLDDEEDLINRLLAEWEVDPYANYGDHGRKT